jgi:hypothetical protein
MVAVTAAVPNSRDSAEPTTVSKSRTDSSPCILCGLPLYEPSNENIIPQWARREFDIQGKVTISARRDEASAELAHRCHTAS